MIQGGAVANQSLNRTDVLDGGPGNDVMFGLHGNDVMDSGPGDDIILGPDGGAAPGGPPNSDIRFGGPGNDVNLWAPGDGSEAFIGGPGLDAIIFGATDRASVADPATAVRLPTARRQLYLLMGQTNCRRAGARSASGDSNLHLKLQRHGQWAWLTVTADGRLA